MVYIAAEEGESVTLQEKIKAIGGSKVTFAENKDRQSIREYLQSKSCDFVFIDSINNAGIDNEFLELIKLENPAKSFISIVQATKGGNFKGDQALTHNCDFIIKVVAGVAYHSGRFNTMTEINIFSEALYEKNPNSRKKKAIIKYLPTDSIDGTEKLQVDEIIPSDIEATDPIDKIEEAVPMDALSAAFASQKLKEIIAPNKVSLPKPNFKKTEPYNAVPLKPMSNKTLFWILGIAGAASIIDSMMKGSKKSETKTPTEKK